MKLTDIPQIRLINQQISATTFKSAKKLVGYMGAMQAQDYAMGKLAIGTRLLNATDKTIEQSINRGDIIRTHALRNTWHFVAAEDLRWMLDLFSERLKKQADTQHRQLNLSEKDFSKSNRIISKLLQDGEHVTREDIVAHLEKSKFSVNENRASHLLIRAELDGIVCRGKIISNKHTYTLLDKWVPAIKKLSREEALHKLSKTFFTSHGPATLQDFTWWSGLTITDAKSAIAMLTKDFATITVEGKQYWLKTIPGLPGSKLTNIYLLPSFDEFIIGYTDRSAVLPTEHLKKIVSPNGIFWPTVIVNGQVTGMWKRKINPDNLIIESAYFKTHNKTVKKLIEAKADELALFWNKPVSLIHS
ncbi:MAG: winged helix DNA-binding domain-containing protein [Agriterribacter sp.]